MINEIKQVSKLKMNIEKFDIRDYDEVSNLWLGTAGIGLRSVDDSRDGVAKFLERNPNTSFVAKINGEIVGVILCGDDGRRGHIYHMAVKGNVRKQGIGRILVDEVIKALRKEGITRVALCVYNNNKVGNEFWERVGFNKRDDLFYRDMTIIDQ